jgi:hypothetical protein
LQLLVSFAKYNRESVDVDSFAHIAAADLNCAIAVDLSDGEGSICWHAHFWLTVPFVCV